MPFISSKIGNVLLLKDGRLGLIDYGQFKILSDKERLAACRIVREIGIDSVRDIDKETLKNAMNDVGFRFRYNKDDDIIRRIASLFFDTDEEKSEFGFPSPQEYLLYLQSKEPIQHIPDSVVFIARTSFLFRGMSALLGEKVRTSHRWVRFAEEALIGVIENEGLKAVKLVHEKESPII
jgi:aarF domain-containing kinase